MVCIICNDLYCSKYCIFVFLDNSEVYIYLGMFYCLSKIDFFLCSVYMGNMSFVINIILY